MPKSQTSVKKLFAILNVETGQYYDNIFGTPLVDTKIRLQRLLKLERKIQKAKLVTSILVEADETLLKHSKNIKWPW